MLSIPEKAAQIITFQEEHLDKIHSRTIFLLGSKNVGKSTLLHMFLEKTDAPRETLVLDYSFGRKASQKQTIDKTVCHIWEFGGKLEMLKSVLPVLPKTNYCCYCIMIDLSKPKTILQTIEICLNAIIDTLSKNNNFKTDLIIMCCKYDLFKNYDTEVKKIVCTTLRSVALLNDSYLVYYSSKESTLAKRAKDIFNAFGFENGISTKEKQANSAKPLFIPKGSDSWESIGVSKPTFEEIQQNYYSKIPPESCDISNDSQGIQKKYPEASIDKLITLTYDELGQMETLDLSIQDYLYSCSGLP